MESPKVTVYDKTLGRDFEYDPSLVQQSLEIASKNKKKENENEKSKNK